MFMATRRGKSGGASAAEEDSRGYLNQPGEFIANRRINTCFYLVEFKIRSFIPFLFFRYLFLK